ncbi:hypothetical protein HU200_010833 [Digitaria exilis]|uniref:Uncharacterized protein n=1 Tax=Digitaria exilis TaxID=1010633 RepID=A0A835KN68_9POAL|nr:hypothetical protein HU200_010833 [Digitaria exilis]
MVEHRVGCTLILPNGHTITRLQFPARPNSLLPFSSPSRQPSSNPAQLVLRLLSPSLTDTVVHRAIPLLHLPPPSRACCADAFLLAVSITTEPFPLSSPLSRPRRLTGAAEPPAFFRRPNLDEIPTYRLPIPCEPPPRAAMPPSSPATSAAPDHLSLQQPEGARHVDHGRRRMIEFARLLAIANARKHAA